MNLPDPHNKVVFYTAWWWPLYTTGLIAFCRLFRTWPAEDKLEAMIYRALRVRKAD